MRRGTTPNIRVTVNADITDMYIYLAFSVGRYLFVLENDDLNIELDESGDSPSTVITATLTQEQTLAMKSGYDCEVQIRAVKDSGITAIATTIAKIPVERILQDGVLSGD